MKTMLVMFLSLVVPQNDSKIDDKAKAKMEEILRQLGDDTVQTRENAQKELEKFLDSDAKVEFLRQVLEKEKDFEIKERVIKAISVFEIRKLGKIAFQDAGHVCVGNADGSDKTQVANAKTLYLIKWSPDGKKIGFVSEEGLFVVNADGSKKTCLLKGSVLEKKGSFGFSPDGKKVVFSYDCDIWISDCEGDNKKQLVKKDEFDAPKGTGDKKIGGLYPICSPDGRALLSGELGKVVTIHKMFAFILWTLMGKA